MIIQVFAASKRDDVRSFDIESKEGHWGAQFAIIPVGISGSA